MRQTTVEYSEKKRLIIETAAALFVEKGFHQTSIRDIAKTAEISLGNLYNHFSGKAELIAAISALEAEEQVQLEAILFDQSNPQKAFKQFVEGYLRIHAQPEDAAISAEILAEAIRTPGIAEGFSKNQKKLSGKLAILLEQGRKQGGMSFDGDAELTALIIIDVLESMSIKSIFYKKQEKKHYLKQVKSLCISIAQFEHRS